jgi:hypothetical protein
MSSKLWGVGEYLNKEANCHMKSMQIAAIFCTIGHSTKATIGIMVSSIATGSNIVSIDFVIG